MNKLLKYIKQKPKMIPKEFAYSDQAHYAHWSAFKEKKTIDIIIQIIVVTSDGKSFQPFFPNVSEKYILPYVKSDAVVVLLLYSGKFKYSRIARVPPDFNIMLYSFAKELRERNCLALFCSYSDFCISNNPVQSFPFI